LLVVALMHWSEHPEELLGCKSVHLVVGALDVVNTPGKVAVIGPFRMK
jgi:hypothetical protein